jgi:hypothetical protein
MAGVNGAGEALAYEANVMQGVACLLKAVLSVSRSTVALVVGAVR